jgi:hypothetical protein
MDRRWYHPRKGYGTQFAFDFDRLEADVRTGDSTSLVDNWHQAYVFYRRDLLARSDLARGTPHDEEKPEISSLNTSNSFTPRQDALPPPK